MRRQKILVAGGVSVFVIVLAGGAFGLNKLNKPDDRTNTNQQAGATLGASSEQTNGSNQQQEENLPMQPDINNEEFILTGSNVSCTTTEVNGKTSRDCSGSILIVPKANNAMEPGLYKINIQTRLLHDGQPQDLNNLQQ
jgi:hypothetical protein